MRYSGLKVREISEALKLSARHVKRLLSSSETGGDMSLRLYAGYAVPGDHPERMDARQLSGNEVLEEKESREEQNAAKSEVENPPS